MDYIIEWDIYGVRRYTVSEYWTSRKKEEAKRMSYGECLDLIKKVHYELLSQNLMTPKEFKILKV